jgi:hypothetical protein
MDTLFEKLDQLSSPLGSLFDTVLNRLAPHTTASACGGGTVCHTGCSQSCHLGGQLYRYWAKSPRDCTLGNTTLCFYGCGTC